MKILDMNAPGLLIAALSLAALSAAEESRTKPIATGPCGVSAGEPCVITLKGPGAPGASRNVSPTNGRAG